MVSTQFHSPSSIMSSSSGPMQTPPFLTKLYELVNDPQTNQLVSWTDEKGLSFTVHKPSEFGHDVLPKYFKHNNFSSFVRQLNQYGFHKQNPDRWMFGHDSFRRQNPELLKNITRRRPKQQPSSSSQAVISPGQTLGSKAVVELGNYGIEGEVKALKRDKDLLIKELVVTRQAEEKLKNKCDNLESRMLNLENSSKQMQAFIMHYFSQVLHPYSEAMASRKRKRLTASAAGMFDVTDTTSSHPNAQPISHAPPPPHSMDALRVMMQQMQVNMARSPSQPQVRAPPVTPPALVEPPARTGPEIAFEPATIQELPYDELASQLPNRPRPHPNIIVSGLRPDQAVNGTLIVRQPDELQDDVLEFLQDMPSTPNSSMTMDAIETALKEPNGRENGRTHLDTQDLGNEGGIVTHSPSCEEGQRAIEDFLDLDGMDDTPLPPPLTHLPEGTDLHALAMRVEGFRDQAATEADL